MTMPLGERTESAITGEVSFWSPADERLDERWVGWGIFPSLREKLWATSKMVLLRGGDFLVL